MFKSLNTAMPPLEPDVNVCVVVPDSVPPGPLLIDMTICGVVTTWEFASVTMFPKQSLTVTSTSPVGEIGVLAGVSAGCFVKAMVQPGASVPGTVVLGSAGVILNEPLVAVVEPVSVSEVTAERVYVPVLSIHIVE